MTTKSAPTASPPAAAAAPSPLPALPACARCGTATDVERILNLRALLPRAIVGGPLSCIWCANCGSYSTTEGVWQTPKLTKKG